MNSDYTCLSLMMPRSSVPGSEKCHGCDGKGWVQVIDPPAYAFGVASHTDTGCPRTHSSGTARAVVCPVCDGKGAKR